MNRLFLSLVATSVVTASSATMSALVLTYVPKGEWRERAERYLVAPGRAIYERAQDQKDVRKIEKEGQKRIEAGQESFQKAADQIKDEVGKTAAGKEAVKAVSARAEKLQHYYNIGAWAVAGFLLCTVMTVMMGISSIAAAISLGFKVTMTLLFLQGMLVFGGLLVLQKLHL